MKIENKVLVKYYAALREQRGISQEVMVVGVTTLRELYEQLQQQYQLSLRINDLRVAVNQQYCSWDDLVDDGDEIVFIPPVNGG